jgi:exoribonuclease-2
VERQANAHWTLVYLSQNPEWQGEGIVVDKRGNRDVMLMPALDMETQVHHRQNTSLNSAVTLAVKDVDIPHLDARFRPI